MADITSYERDVLRHLRGDKVDGLIWGAAMAEAIDYLRGSRLVDVIRTPGKSEYRINSAGRQLLREEDLRQELSRK